MRRTTAGWVSFGLVAVGAANWGLKGFFGHDLVGLPAAGQDDVIRGLAALGNDIAGFAAAVLDYLGGLRLAPGDDLLRFLPGFLDDLLGVLLTEPGEARGFVRPGLIGLLLEAGTFIVGITVDFVGHHFVLRNAGETPLFL